MPARISDNWVAVISIDTASVEVLGIWNEPISSRLILASQYPRCCSVTRPPYAQDTANHESEVSGAIVQDGSWE
jgi:hypothetical protein